MSDKHLIHSPNSLVVDSLRGLCALNSRVKLDETNKVVFQANQDRSKVALVCGGGSGHEPAHAGFVGSGILTAAVCGNVFASPNAGQVRRSIDLVDNEKGTLIIVKNYTGDILNFGLAKEQYAAVHPEKADQLKFVIVADDVAVGRTQGSIVGRRGLAGTVLVYKIAGALARRGADLSEVYNVAQWVSSRIGTVGVGLEHCHVPGSEPASSHLSSTEVEIGMGIHNEPGNMRVSPIPPLDKLIIQLLDLITSTTDTERSFVPFQNSGADEVIVLVNNLGGVSELELSGVVGAVVHELRQRGIKIHRVLSGPFMTSLNMPGFSISLLLLPRPSEADAPSLSSLLSLLDEQVDVPGWKWSSASIPVEYKDYSVETEPAAVAKKTSQKLGAVDGQGFVPAIQRACKALVAAESEITRMDSIAGDGDCGLTLKNGAEAILKRVDQGKIKGDDVNGSVLAIAEAVDESMDGTSGALYSIFFSSLAQGLASNTSQALATRAVWASALDTALTRLYTYTRARPPSRTLVDPLAAFIQAIASSGSASDAVKAASDAAEATRNIDAKAGRSAYVDAERLKSEKVPDPGAWGVKILLEGLLA